MHMRSLRAVGVQIFYLGVWKAGGSLWLPKSLFFSCYSPVKRLGYDVDGSKQHQGQKRLNSGDCRCA